jgi:PhoPQ-activated pathogenicity-related protein
LGFWAPAVGDYEKAGIMDWFGTPEMQRLMEIEDPFTYRERYTMPKLMINSAGDQFFLADSSRFYFDRLPGEKYLRYVPNTDHGLDKSDAGDTLQAFYTTLLQGRERPQFDWEFTQKGIRVSAGTRPSVVRLWQAVNPKTRDFRLEKIGPIWRSKELRAGKDGAYVADVRTPRTGWSAAFVELEFPSGGKYPLKFTTAVRIAPDTLPHDGPPRIRASRTAR